MKISIKNIVEVGGYAILFLFLLYFLLYFGRKLQVKLNPDKYLGPDEPINPELLPKSKEHYREIAKKLYRYMKGWGTEDEELEALITSLTEEELKVIANHFKNYLLEVGETDCGNIINWLESDGRSDLAERFRIAGVKAGHPSGWFC